MPTIKKESSNNPKPVSHREKKYFSKYKEPLTEMPDLLEAQLKSYEWLLEKGIKEILDEFSPVEDYSAKKFEISFSSFTLEKPKYDEFEAKNNKASYESSIKGKVKLRNKSTGEENEQEIFLTEVPLMTDHGTFVVNGVERVIVPQLARSFGVFFNSQDIKAKKYFGAKIIPSRGAWFEFETDQSGAIFVRVDRKRKFSVTSLLKILGLKDEKEILEAFNTDEEKEYIKNSLEKDTAKNVEEAYVEVYKRLRDGDVASYQNAKEVVDSIFSEERYDLSLVGRHRFNMRFEKPLDEKSLEKRVIDLDDILTIISHVVKLNTTPGSEEDDIDHLGFRRVRYVGELLQQKFRMGMMQMKRNIQDRMSTVDASMASPVQIINQRPLQARIKEFFTTNQLSQFMNQENVVAEVEHLRTLSALGPGGLTRERAGLDVRDVHPSHYGRLCPIHTPEGPNIGLILHLSCYARINDLGIVETPYLKIKNGKLTDEVVYLNALDEERSIIAHSGVRYNEKGELQDQRVEVRDKHKPGLVEKKDVEYIDVAGNQAFSVATSMIPFLEHDEANRALMGSSMQKQSTPCVLPEAPLVATGLEEKFAKDSGRLIMSEEAGEVTYVDAEKVKVKNSKGKEKEYKLVTFSRTNDFSLFHHRPAVETGQKVKKGQLLADVSSTSNGQAAVGQNCLVAFMSWDGRNYEDAVIISDRLVKESKFTSIHVEEFVSIVRDTKLGPEVTTHDIPNVGEHKLKDLDEEGIVRVGAEVRPNDILVGKITPKGETELTPEERLLRSIFGEKSRDVKDSSLRMEHGKKGRVINVKVFSRDRGDNLESGVIKKVYIEIAQVRNITVGDKLAGRHGNKGVISKILPVEEMPFMDDGTPIDVILTPLGVPSRMNLGQILELHLGMAAESLNYQAIVPPFSGAKDDEIKKELKSAGLQEDGKMTLYDGRTGESFDQQISVGYMYILKLHHMVEDKIHMRSIGPYSLITQQPLGGKAQGGGQRFGEMEVWALEGYGAAYALREMLTIKSDDITGRTQAFDSIIKGEKIKHSNVPASFNVLVNNLRGLALDIELISKKEDIETDN